MMKVIVTALLLLVSLGYVCSQKVESTNRSSREARSNSVTFNRVLLSAMQDAWRVSWERFYHPRTQQFYDYLTSYKKGKGLDHLPTSAEVARLFPNSYGYDTGMEDCMISAGVMLMATVDRYAVTGEAKLRDRAYSILQGIKRSATDDGFLARGVTPQDGRSMYIGTSRDQYTHAVHGLWYYYQSPLSDDRSREEIATLLGTIAARMKRNVTVENNYNLLRLDGTCDPNGIQRMWNVSGHEAARLPMIYAAAWVATGNDEYHRLYRHYLVPALEQSRISMRGVSTWALLQMQCSMELLLALEGDEALRDMMKEIMRTVAVECGVRAGKAWRDGEQLDLTVLASDWRLPDGGIKSNGSYRKAWYCIRQSGESAIPQIMVGPQSFDQDQKKMLVDAITRLDYKKVSSSGIFYLQSAYWKARRNGLL